MTLVFFLLHYYDISLHWHITEYRHYDISLNNEMSLLIYYSNYSYGVGILGVHVLISAV